MRHDTELAKEHCRGVFHSNSWNTLVAVGCFLQSRLLDVSLLLGILGQLHTIELVEIRAHLAEAPGPEMLRIFVISMQ